MNNVGEIVIPKKSVLLTLDEEFLQEIYHRYEEYNVGLTKLSFFLIFVINVLLCC